jgi:hypothetical protein
MMVIVVVFQTKPSTTSTTLASCPLSHFLRSQQLPPPTHSYGSTQRQTPWLQTSSCHMHFKLSASNAFNKCRPRYERLQIIISFFKKTLSYLANHHVFSTFEGCDQWHPPLTCLLPLIRMIQKDLSGDHSWLEFWVPKPLTTHPGQ